MLSAGSVLSLIALAIGRGWRRFMTAKSGHQVAVDRQCN